MGQKDLSEKLLFDYNDVFADIFNVLIFNGEQKLGVNELQNCSVQSQYKAQDGLLHEQERDVVKRWKKNGVTFSILGLENQSTIDKLIPIRIMSYDAAAYREQLRNAETIPVHMKPSSRKRMNIAPVISIVLYFGEKRWDSPIMLKDIIGDIPAEMNEFVNDYKVHVFNIAYLSEEIIEKFTSDFGIVADFFVQKRINKNYIPDDKRKIQHVDELLKLLSVMSGDEAYQKMVEIPTLKGAVSVMCDVAQNLLKIGRKEGLEEGIKEGIKEGITVLVDTLKEMGQTNDFIVKKIMEKFSLTEEDAKQYL